MITYKNATKFFMITVYVFAGIISLQLLWSFAIYFIDTFIRKKEPSYFFNRKRQFYIEYTFQRLNGHPSSHWVAMKKKEGNPGKFYNDTDEQYRKNYFRDDGNDEVVDLDEESKEIMPNSTKNGPRNLSIQDESKIEPSAINDYRKSLSNSLLSDYAPPPVVFKKNRKYTAAELKEMPMDSIAYDDQTWKQKLMRCFTPFDLLYRRVWIKDCFIYPQILIASIVITSFSMGYLGYKTVSFILKLSDYIDEGYEKVYTSAFTFMRTGLEKYFFYFKYEPTKDEFGHYFNKLESVGDRVHELSIAIKIGASVGLTLAVVAIFCNFIWILYDYKRRVLLARRGVYEFNINKVPLETNALLPAAIISNSILMYFLIMIVLTLVCAIACWTVTWGILWKVKWILLEALIGILVNVILRVALNYFCYGFDNIKRRWLLGIFDFVLLNIAILAGFVTALKRFGILFGILFASLFRIDVNSMPGWISRYLYLDSFNKAYYASILVQHYLNNPILVTFYNLMFKITVAVNSNKNYTPAQKERMNKKKMIRNRFYLWLLLNKNPIL